MTDATGDSLMESEIMERLAYIDTVYTRTRPCLTVLDHVLFVLKLYWSNGVRLKTYVHT